jgi:uncharacterized surface protein with fasciclin (FAS1) repeats
MRTNLLGLLASGAALGLAGCGGDGEGTNQATANESGEAAEAAGNQTIAAGLDQNGRFFQAARAAGLDATLAGPGPYTVLVPTDDGFGKLPQGRFDDLTRQENRAELTRLLTYHILPGTVLVEDIGRAIENSDGRAVLATMGGETVTATRDGDAIILTDSAGNEARITQGDVRRTNGVVHMVDAVLIPPELAPDEEGQEGENAQAQ